MKRLVSIVFLVLCNLAAAQSVLLGKTLIGKGDSVMRARDAAGEPGKLDRIAGDEFSPAMEIWTYRRDDAVVTLWVVAGKIVKVAQEHSAQVATAGATSATPGAANDSSALAR